MVWYNLLLALIFAAMMLGGYLWLTIKAPYLAR
jgi:ethanolamine ammonia-lyase large subunit